MNVSEKVRAVYNLITPEGRKVLELGSRRVDVDALADEVAELEKKLQDLEVVIKASESFFEHHGMTKGGD